jgi:LacI family transcriptional regulator
MTTKEIAELAGVSEGTVDRVIHNRPGVARTTFERVNKLLVEFGYKANPLARALAVQHDLRIGVVIPKASSLSGFWDLPLAGIKSYIAKNAQFKVKVTFFQYDLYNLTEFKEACRLLLKEGTWNAVVIAPLYKPESIKFCKQLEVKKIPYFFLNNSIPDCREMSAISQDSFKAGRTAAKLASLYTAHKKYSRILVLSIGYDEIKLDSIKNRVLGFKEYFKEINVKQELIEDVIPAEQLEEMPEDTFDGFDVIFVPSSRIASIRKFKYNYPTKLIGFDATSDNLQLLKSDYIEALISQDPFAQGSDIMRIVFDYLLFNQFPETQYKSPIDILFKENIAENITDHFTVVQ